ncbi:MAG: RpiB/LacA/LacB family sugar-phosphate isomerase [Candidatus Omnitrophica bacterium]|nr:RpiB/LacA/LacB family sugar-phosphate isomerase [Candidatus Omnitrophota bacterium]MCA9446242.1 RpiB/LacA/LacB family sugar-phosphate isomerase [Candidatus Omnitrophota bacterium]MCB9768486.1 RpiB/LacA/LacB family sugar-phosphate isomerase [Candidatus Omnitrophota bacterium]
MRIAVACDHGGFPLKSPIVELIEELGHEVVDLGAYDFEPLDDYPDFAEKAGKAVSSGDAERAVIICGSGVGACIAANKIVGVRASVCHDAYSAHQGVEHDDMNTLCLGARIVGSELALEVVKHFVQSTFTGEERHRRRLEKVRQIERNNLTPESVR